MIGLIHEAEQDKTVEEMCAAANHLPNHTQPLFTSWLCKKLATEVKNEYKRGKSDLYILQKAEAVRFKFINPNIC